MSVLNKKQMSEEDIKLNYITPALQSRWSEHITMETKVKLANEDRKKKVFDYNMFEWTYPGGLATNAHRKYINRMQEMREDNECFKKEMEQVENSEQDGEQ
ncbi:MAG: hypothetical protein K6E64_03825 [Lachnospiraceae bacterium]|nr:hypothetical protein [Lachnospiraceae bacterium]